MRKSAKERSVTVRLPRISGSSDAVYVSVGERSWRIKRGCEVTIPLCAYDVLRNSELAEDRAVSYMETIR
ncbi:MAG: hypothetical protein IJA55_03770 [Clostridia bacterium]|nr:hypothetical protein [Clostridia bacterium]